MAGEEEAKGGAGGDVAPPLAGASPKAETARQALLLSVQTLGVNAAAVEEERAAKEAALAENKALLDFVFLGKDEEALGELLREACKEGSLSVVRRALAEGACVDARNPGGWTPLIAAARAGRVAVVRALLAAGAAPGGRSNSGWTALHITVDEVVARLLLEAGADASLRSGFGRTVVGEHEHSAADEGTPAGRRAQHAAVAALVRQWPTRRAEASSSESDGETEGSEGGSGGSEGGYSSDNGSDSGSEGDYGEDDDEEEESESGEDEDEAGGFGDLPLGARVAARADGTRRPRREAPWVATKKAREAKARVAPRANKNRPREAPSKAKVPFLLEAEGLQGLAGKQKVRCEGSGILFAPRGSGALCTAQRRGDGATDTCLVSPKRCPCTCRRRTLASAPPRAPFRTAPSASSTASCSRSAWRQSATRSRSR